MQDFYELRYNPRGTCLVINNEHFTGTSALANRPGTEADESKPLHEMASVRVLACAL